MLRRRGVFFGDIHFPFHQPTVLALAIYVAIKGRYAYAVQVGDLYDWYSAAKFPRSFNVFTPKQEKQWSRHYAEVFWSLLQKHMPGVECFQIRGNHDVRPEKRVIELAPEFESDLESSMQEHYNFDGVKTIHDSREELYIDDLAIIHGYYCGAGDKHAAFNLKNIIAGHTHRGNVAYLRNNGHDGGCLWELNAGYLANPYSRGLGYAAQKRATRWTWGLGTVDEWGPRFIPLHPNMAKDFEKDPLFQEILEAFKYSGA